MAKKENSSKPKVQKLQHGQNLKEVKAVVKLRKPLDNESVTLRSRKEKLQFVMDTVYNEAILCNSDYNVFANGVSRKLNAVVEKPKK